MTPVVTNSAAEQAGPLDRLRTLADQDRLASEYPSVATLLAGLEPEDLARAGRLLDRLDREEVLRHHPDTPVLAVAVTGSSTLGGLVPPLTGELARHGMLSRLTVGDYDGWITELQDVTGPLYTSGTELVLCVLDAEAVFHSVPSPWRAADVEAASAELLALVDRLAAQYMEHGTGTLVLNTIPLLRAHTHQLVDLASRAALGAAWREFNAGLLRLTAKHERVVVVDLDPLLAEGGPIHDVRLAAYARAQLGDELLGRYAREIGHLARTLRGRAKKVLVVDLDNTLWDGILGDDGKDGIAAATTFRGEAFGQFQQVVKQLGSQGVLLAVSSKNDQEPVLEVLRDHPDMVLREEDFVQVNANWQPKDGNLRDIAGRLNLGTDSLVFVDDSSFETGLVLSSLPEVAVVPLDEEPASHISRLLADGWFDVRELTAEDRARAGQYRSEAARQSLLENTGSQAEYLAELGIRVELSPVREHEIARVAQLTLRTNQFNLTTERLQTADVRTRLADPGHWVLAVRTSDRFGDQGLVGAVFARRSSEALYLDNVILSCRVFSRGIEQTVLAAVLGRARELELPAVRAAYRPTAKNHRVRAFYPSLGFRTSGGTQEAPDFEHDLLELPSAPEHVRLEAAL
ncbi:HAD-IIIC family phosphatase [Kitasatospora azatica]|uniref:HAD-IIIC family phosphatase n=1 Tax=Kitasatospora azatica TaxID=58347 RepID=UPI0005618FFA|nr:HAD-IIIC family phosphatase [Kitasatospora azatica]